jgi:hypothetical protein
MKVNLRGRGKAMVMRFILTFINKVAKSEAISVKKKASREPISRTEDRVFHGEEVAKQKYCLFYC